MSYYSGAVPYLAVAQGNLTSGTASATVTTEATTQTLPGDLLVLVLYATVDPAAAIDAGEGWVLLDSGFDGANGYGIAMWVAVSAKAGLTRTGLTLASSGNWAAVLSFFRPLSSLRWGLSGKVAGGNWYNATADSRSMSWNPYRGAGFAGNGLQGVELLGAGCANGGVVPTATAPTGYTERADQGIVAAPSMNISLNYRVPATANLVTNYALTTVTNSTYYTTSGAQTNRASVRGFVPIVGLSSYPGRYFSGRRFMG